MAAMKKWAILGIVVIVVGGIVFVSQSRASAKHQAKIKESLDSAHKYFETSRYSKAEDELRFLKSEEPTEEVLALLARTLEAQERPDEALDVWEALQADNPDTPFAGDIKLAQANAAVRAKDFVTSAEIFDEIAKAYPATDVAARARLGLVDIAYREGRLNEARDVGVTLLDEPAIDDASRERLEKIIGEINIDSLYSKEPGPGDELYTVQRGDYISKIANENSLSQGLLMKVNGISDPRKLSVGHRIKIPKLDLKLVVDKHDNTMTVYSGGKFFKKYKVRTGELEYMTPTGEFSILNKKENPQWTRPATGEVIAPGAPDNELGTRWMAFEGSQLGIHGTIKPETIGQYASQGCVGMLKEDIEELYDYIAIGTPVIIQGKQNPELKSKI